MNLSKAMTSYLVHLGEMFAARLVDKDETDILDKLDEDWKAMTSRERGAAREITNALNRLDADSMARTVKP